MALQLETEVSFTSDKFKRTGKLTGDNTNINNFYGYDLALYICEKLPDYAFGIIKEDWGFHLYSTHDLQFFYSVEVGGKSDNEDNTWTIILRTEQIVPLFVIFRRYAQIQCSDKLVHAIMDILSHVATDLRCRTI